MKIDQRPNLPRRGGVHAPDSPRQGATAPIPKQPAYFTQKALWHFALPLLLAAVLLLAALWPRTAFTLDVGQPGDRLFLENVHGDERIAEYSYRWTGKGQQPMVFTVPGWGAITAAQITIRARALPDSGPRDLHLAVNGQSIGTLPISTTMAEATTTIAIPAAGRNPNLALALDSQTSRVNGDNRDFGVMVDRITITPLARSSGAYWATVWQSWFLALALCGVLFALLSQRLTRPLLIARYAIALLVPAALLLSLPWTLALLPTALKVALAALLLRWYRPMAAAATAGWRRLNQRRPATTAREVTSFWQFLDHSRTATLLVIGIIGVYVGLILPFLLQVPWINHADYADNAVVARNIVQGRGFTVDYVAQFYRDWPTVRHPADTWPPLQPLLIAASFALFGVSTAAAKLPNLLIMVVLLWLVFRVGRAVWAPRVGLIAVLLVVCSPDLFEGVVYPLNDTTFTLLSFSCIVLLGLDGATLQFAAPRWANRLPRFLSLRWLLLGVLGGLLLLCKPSGALLLAGGGAWAVWQGWRTGQLAATLRGGAVAALLAALVWLPWGIRNIVTFGVPFYSTESFDAWLLGYRDWETIYTVYVGRGDLPHPRLLVSYGVDTVSDKIMLQFIKLKNDLFDGTLLPLLTLAAATLGLLVARGSQRKLLGALGAATLPYFLFINTYWHYEPRYTLWLLPWAALLGAAGLWWLHDRLLTVLRPALAGLTLLVILGLILVPQGATIIDDGRADLRISNPLVVAWWVRDNTPANAVIMTRNPWELSFHSERQSVMIPFDNLATIQQIGQQYGVTYLQLNHLNERATRRPALAPLYGGVDEWNGFRKVFDRRDENGEGLLVYTFPQAGR